MQTSNCFDLRLIPPNQLRSNREMATGAGDLILSYHCSKHHNGVKKKLRLTMKPVSFTHKEQFLPQMNTIK